MEIFHGRPEYTRLLNQAYKISELILCEYYGVLFKEQDEKAANEWYEKLLPYVETTPIHVFRDALIYRLQHKALNLSIFDAIGYQHALSNNGLFVTGDKSFEKLPHVKYVK